eukprot:gene3936-7864_t
MIAIRVVQLAVTLIAVSAFVPSKLVSQARGDIKMSAEKPSAAKIFGAAMLAASMVSMPVFAKEGAGAKLSFFGDDSKSSPYTLTENREDPIYSPYSPYGNGGAAAYNSRRGSKEEVGFWKKQLDTCIGRTKNIPALTNQKKWQAVRTEMTSYSYNMREALLRIAETSKDPKAATAAAKQYFNDLNDMFVMSQKKDGTTLLAVYDLSVKDLDNFLKIVQVKSLLKPSI